MRIAPRVYTAQADIERLQARIGELPNDARVELSLADGAVLRGIVAARPMTTQFFDAEGREGTNGVVRLEQPALDTRASPSWIDVFLDRIVDVRRVDSLERDAAVGDHRRNGTH